MKTIILFGLVLGTLSAAGKVYIAEVGGKVTLQCGVTRLNNGLEWKRDGLRVIRVEKNGFPTKGKNEFGERIKALRDTDLEISKIKESDSGKFTCVAQPSSHEHHLIVVSVSAPSGPLEVGADATLDCKTTSGVSNQFITKVEWKKPDGSVHNKPKVELKPVALSDKGTWQCEVSYQGVNFTKTVTINVKEPVVPTPTPTLVKNSENGKTSIDGISIQPGDRMLLLGLAWWIWVAIGAGGLVVIILIIVIIVIYKRNKRRKKKFQRMKKAQLAQKPKKYCQCVRQTAAAKPHQGRRREKPPALPLQPLLQE